MTRIKQISTDFIRLYPLNPCHPWAIFPKQCDFTIGDAFALTKNTDLVSQSEYG